MADLTGIEASQSVKIVGNDATGTETNPVRASANGDLNVGDLLTVGGTQSNLTVGTSAVEVKVGASKLANRKCVTVMPVDADMYWGWTSGVTTSTGTPIFKSQKATFEVNDTATIFLICASASKNARITESP